MMMILEYTYNDDMSLKQIALFVIMLFAIFGLCLWLFFKIMNHISLDRKAEIAKERNHVIESTLIDDISIYRLEDYDCMGIYEYTWHGEIRNYRTRFSTFSKPPQTLQLYYLDDPRKLFSPLEYHSKFLEGVLHVFFLFILPVVTFCAFLLWLLDLY